MLYKKLIWFFREGFNLSIIVVVIVIIVFSCIENGCGVMYLCYCIKWVRIFDVDSFKKWI